MTCFNPCSNGMKKEPYVINADKHNIGFNPCSNGMKKELPTMRTIQC